MQPWRVASQMGDGGIEIAISARFRQRGLAGSVRGAGLRSNSDAACALRLAEGIIDRLRARFVLCAVCRLALLGVWLDDLSHRPRSWFCSSFNSPEHGEMRHGDLLKLYRAGPLGR